MDKKEAEFLKKLLAMFKIEGREHLDAISLGLMEMAKGDSAAAFEVVETVYREAHSLKGAARSVNLPEVVTLCQGMENVFSAMKSGRIAPSVPICDALQQLVDYCYRLVDNEEIPVADRLVIRKVITRLEGTALAVPDRESASRLSPIYDQKAVSEAREPVVQLPASTLTGPAATDTIRIALEKLDALLLKAEEMIAIKLAAGHRAAELRDLKKSFELWRRKQSRVHLPGADGRRTGSFFQADPFVSFFDARLTAMVREAEYDHRTSVAMIDTMLDDVKKTLMLPCSSLLQVFPRLARDLGREAGKKVELTLMGGDIEIDRRVMEEMKDPLIHLIRNCVDHGIEPAGERERKGKPVEGRMKIAVSSKDGKIEITVADDGAGIDLAKVTSSAVRQEVISRQEADRLDDRAAMQLIFHSGVTTSPLITDISGRGLGLAIVLEKVEKLNGEVTVDSHSGTGTTFRMVVPLTLATFRGTLVRLADQIFVLPSTNVERVTRVARETVRTIENRETLAYEGRPISLVRLHEVLGMNGAAARRERGDDLLQVVILGLGEQRMAFEVDEILREQEVLVKPLGSQLARVRNIAGATVLTNGRVAAILNIADLLKSVAKNGASYRAGDTAPLEKRLSVLVVEDSITARALLKNILESAGYQVQTAVDGLEGFTALKSKEFDIVVSDVEMPRMNGFDLTGKIRADKKLSELPVVLVTALESREDRARGIDVGANAYIVKSSFDQSNLLEVIERLL